MTTEAAPRRAVVVGASLAGLRAAETLRARGFAGELTVVGAERHPPYNRPPLSKQLLAGTMDLDRCTFKQKPDLGATWRLGVAATGLDLARREVALADGARLPFDRLVIATGAAPRPWPGGPVPDLDGIFALRELDHALALHAAAAAARRAVILGAGFIGCEVAATLRGLGVEVTLVDIAPHPLAPLGPELGALVAALHAEHGVDVRMSTRVAGFEGEGGRIAGVRLAGGERLPADLLLIAVGAKPNVEWLAGSGLRVGRGLVCDRFCLVEGAEGVAGAGDVTEFPHPLADGELVHIEHWSNAAEQGVAAAANLLAAPEERTPYEPVPSFWSDQYDVKVQSVGFPEAGELRVVEGSLEERRFVAAAARRGRLTGAVAFNSARRIPWYRRQVAGRAAMDDVLAELAAAA
jgi:NADPH-dependent 2,4-dienoyl-CoA reductase/sulfur reductase-like enzyme